MLGVVVGVLPFVVSADPITDTDVSIDFIIDDGDPTDLHDDYGWLVAGSGVSSTIRVNYTGSGSPVIHFVQVTSVEKAIYGDVVGGGMQPVCPVMHDSLHQRMWQEMHRYECRSITPSMMSGMTITGRCTSRLIITRR